MAMDVKSIQAFGEQVISEMCDRLLQGGAPGLHFYTLNQSEPSLAIWNNLKLAALEICSSSTQALVYTGAFFCDPRNGSPQ